MRIRTKGPRARDERPHRRSLSRRAENAQWWENFEASLSPTQHEQLGVRPELGSAVCITRLCVGFDKLWAHTVKARILLSDCLEKLMVEDPRGEQDLTKRVLEMLGMEETDEPEGVAG